jgi:tetratricopeptide (TPR) repeat protein
LVYSDQKDNLRAIADFSEAIRLSPTSPDPFWRRGIARIDVSEFAEAITDLDKALQLTPDNAAYLNSRCVARLNWGQQLDLALTDCDASIKLRESSLFYRNRGVVQLRRGDFQRALTDFDAALRLASSSPGSLYGRGLAQLRMGRTAAGQADIAAALAKDPSIGTSYTKVGLTP